MMTNNPPSLPTRVYSIWFRHFTVYKRHLLSNAFPPFFEPLIFIVGIGLGLGNYVETMDGVPYIQFLAPGLLLVPAMFVSSFECTLGTFIRLEFDKVYDGMLSAPMSIRDVFIGEILWAGTKGAFFAFAVLLVVSLFGILPLSAYYFAPLLGFLTGILFAAIALLFTSYITTISHVNFFLTGFLSPMFFFSGVVFPISDLPAVLLPLVEAFPLTHVVRLLRDIAAAQITPTMLWDISYCVIVTWGTGAWAIHRLQKRITD